MGVKISIIIVHYKVKKELLDCLRSIKSVRSNISYEVIVIDNDENETIKQEIRRKFPWISYYKTEKNNGFGSGNNMGAKYAKGEYLFFLNPDTIIFKDTLENLYTFLKKNKKTGIVAPLLFDPKGNPYSLQGTKLLTPLRAFFGLSFLDKLFPKNPISKNYWLRGWDKTRLQEVEVVPGTAF